MNFVLWLFKRMKRKLFSSAPFRFVESYRNFIQDEFFGAIVITLLIGVVQFIICAAFIAWCYDSRPPQVWLYILLANPVVFFVYNWLVVLYQIYDTERMACWERLKE